jgi:ribonuclease M5
MLDIPQAIVVEGRYDAAKLRQIVNAPVFETSGFGVMNDKKLLSLLRRVAQKRGLIILTDPDGAGFVIRNFLRGALPKDRVLHAYVPDIYGKERRKEKPGKEGKLGVEGMDEATILRALQNAGVQASDAGELREPITKFDLYACGLSGCEGSHAARAKLLKSLDLPERMSANALLQALNVLYDREEFLRIHSTIGD